MTSEGMYMVDRRLATTGAAQSELPIYIQAHHNTSPETPAGADWGADM